MGLAQHTPGPWEEPHFVRDDIECNCASVVEQGFAGGICTIHLDNGIVSIADGGNDAPKLEEARANARLIAASPELLEALEAFVEETDGTFPFASLVLAKKAIAKARGN